MKEIRREKGREEEEEEEMYGDYLFMDVLISMETRVLYGIVRI